jgi:hypothetical protein
MKELAELLALVQAERDSLLPFFDSFAQLGDAYAALDRVEQGAEFEALFERLHPLPDDPPGIEKLNELRAARAWLIHMALAFSSERADGKWPELLRHEAREAVGRLNAAVGALSGSSGR